MAVVIIHLCIHYALQWLYWHNPPLQELLFQRLRDHVKVCEVQGYLTAGIINTCHWMEKMLWDKVISAIKNAIRRPMFRQINCLYLLTLYILTRVAIAVNFWNCIPCFDCGSTETYEHPFQKSPKMVAGLICTGCKRTWSLHLLLLSRQDITTEHRSTTCTYHSNVKLLASIARNIQWQVLVHVTFHEVQGLPLTVIQRILPHSHAAQSFH